MSSVRPLVVKGGSIWIQHQKHTFQNEFCVEIWVTGKVLQKTQMQQKIENRTYGFKMAANKLFEISRHQFSRQKWESTIILLK